MSSIPPVEIRVLFALTYLALSIAGIIPNILLAIVLYKNRGKLPQQSFFALATQILICDFGQLMTQLVVAFPMSIQAMNIFQGSASIWIYNITNAIGTVCYHGVVFFTFVMAVNRFTVFVVPKMHQVLFNRLHIWRTLASVWCLILFEVTVANMLQCWKEFSYDDFYFYVQCYNPSTLLPVVWMKVLRCQTYVLPAIMFVLYIWLFIHLRVISHPMSHSNQAAQIQRKAEINLVFQAVILSSFLELQTLSFSFFPSVGEGYNKYYSALAQNVINIMSNSINPFVYFLFNKQIRSEVIDLYCGECFLTRKRSKTTRKVFDRINI